MSYRPFWEYKVFYEAGTISISNQNWLHRQLEAYGAEGWELVSVVPQFEDGEIVDSTLIFKRSTPQ